MFVSQVKKQTGARKYKGEGTAENDLFSLHETSMCPLPDSVKSRYQCGVGPVIEVTENMNRINARRKDDGMR